MAILTDIDEMKRELSRATTKKEIRAVADSAIWTAETYLRRLKEVSPLMDALDNYIGERIDERSQ